MSSSAFDSAVRLLKARAKSRARLEAALEGRGFSTEEIGDAIARVTKLGYLDDRRYAEAKARTELGQGRSQDGVQRRLEAEGVDEAVAAEAVKAAAEDSGHDDAAAAKKLIEKRRLTGIKAARFLASRGFDSELIRKVVGNVFTESP